MSYQIVVITTPYLRQYMEDVCRKYPEDITCRIVEYRAFSELEELYLRCEQGADGFLTSGIVVQTVLERAFPALAKPILSLGSDQESIYKVALDLLINNRYLDPGRIIFDVFVDIVPDPSILTLIESKSLVNTYPEFASWLDQAPLEELYQIEERTVSRICELWENNRIDIVICRYSSIVPKLKEREIPCVFASATDDCVHLTIRHLLTQIKFSKISEHQPAVISVVLDNSTLHFQDSRKRAALKKALKDFAAGHDIHFVFQEDAGEFLLFTDKSVLAYLTDNFQKDILSARLRDCLDFRVLVSYGIGVTFEQAQENARTALREAENSGLSFLVDENLLLNGPLDASSPLVTSSVVAPQVQRIAQQASLSPVTVQRIDRLTKLLGRRELSARDLADNFRMTMRNANRILKNLENGGLVQVIRQKSGHRGRPSKIYRIEWDI